LGQIEAVCRSKLNDQGFVQKNPLTEDAPNRAGDTTTFEAAGVLSSDLRRSNFHQARGHRVPLNVV